MNVCVCVFPANRISIATSVQRFYAEGRRAAPKCSGRSGTWLPHFLPSTLNIFLPLFHSLLCSAFSGCEEGEEFREKEPLRARSMMEEDANTKR